MTAPGAPLTVRVGVEGDGRAASQAVGGDGRVVLDAGRAASGPA